MRKVLAPLAVTCLLSTGLAAAPATASTSSTIYVSDSSNTIVYDAGSGQKNNPVVASGPVSGPDDWWYTIRDVAPITAGRGCKQVEGDPNAATCPLPDLGTEYWTISLNLGDLSDRADVTGFGARGPAKEHQVNGGPGDDVIIADQPTAFDGTEGENLSGGDGNDTIIGGSASRGQNGNDTISGSTVEDGGAGNDQITGLAETDPRFGSRIWGGTGNDVIDGSSHADQIWGNSGNDTIRGAAGNDVISGGPGNDTVYGNSGNDTISGGPGTDRLSGGPGRDTLKQ
jgi:Ca2+-binding RTX toxin-like protein